MSTISQPQVSTSVALHW